MTNHDATHAFDNGAFAAAHGFSRHTMPRGTWMTKFAADWLAGFDEIVRQGNWNSWPI